MRPSVRASALAFIGCIEFVSGASAQGGASPALIAAINARCNFGVAGSLERAVRADDRRAPGTTAEALETRQQELESILQQAQLESDILHNVCTESELVPVQDQLAGVIAWAYLLESEIAPQRFAFAHCPQTAAAAPQALVANAWYALASTIDPQSPAPLAPLVKEVMPKVQARAATLAMTLPAPPTATEYWRNTVGAGVPACPQPSP